MLGWYSAERNAVRVVVIDAGGKVFLLHVLTPDEAPDGWWELPGGGIDPVMRLTLDLSCLRPVIGNSDLRGINCL